MIVSETEDSALSPTIYLPIAWSFAQPARAMDESRAALFPHVVRYQGACRAGGLGCGLGNAGADADHGRL